jgi:hypothetical protein
MRIMPTKASSDAVGAVSGVENEAGIDKSSIQNTSNSKEKVQEMADESTTMDAMSDTQVDVSLPLNWSTKKKLLNMAVPSFICFVV